jgi:cation diffusion facilitator family transporter
VGGCAPDGDHVFGQDRPREGERRTRWVLLLTASTMVVEIVAGLVYGSMALLADGLHMGSHAAALGLSVLAYVFARRRARDLRFSFGTGKLNALAGFAGAILLAGFALVMVVESVERFVHPVPIAFDHALVVAVLGLAVNGISVLLLDVKDHEHGHAHDHNLRSAYLHVLADALTSLLAIAALLSGKYLGWMWLDPGMGLVGATLVVRWSTGLARQSARVLLDRRAEGPLRAEVEEALAPLGRLVDLHLWSIGPGLWAGEIVLGDAAVDDPAAVRRRLPAGRGLVHVVVELRRA